jgi:hypothetical protein
LEIDLQRAIEGELEGLILCLTHRHSTSSPSPIASKPRSVNSSASSYHISSTLGKWKSGIISENFRANPNIDHKDDRKNRGMKGAQALPAPSPPGRGPVRQVLIRGCALLVARIALLYDRFAGRRSVGNKRGEGIK